MIVLTDKTRNKPKGDFRDAVFGAIEAIMLADEHTVLLTNDMGAVGLDKIRQFAPTRVINIGITEQNMMSVAGGLAVSGYTVFVFGIISHIIFRALEQIKLDICVPNLPVIIVGIGAGLAYGVDGPTHQGLEDMAITRVLPNLSVFNPSDCISAGKSIDQAYQSKTPCFIRIDKENLPNLYDETQSLDSGMLVHGLKGNGVIVCTGMTTWAGLQALEILSSKGISCQVIDLIRIKPFAEEEFQSLCENVRWVVVVDEATSCGGLGELISSMLIGKSMDFFTTINLGGKFLLGSAKREWAWQKFGIDGELIWETILKKLNR
jgi:transketolase